MVVPHNKTNNLSMGPQAVPGDNRTTTIEKAHKKAMQNVGDLRTLIGLSVGVSEALIQITKFNPKDSAGIGVLKYKANRATIELFSLKLNKVFQVWALQYMPVDCRYDELMELVEKLRHRIKQTRPTLGQYI